jgi:branched-chain amino acid transport system permease protein
MRRLSVSRVLGLALAAIMLALPLAVSNPFAIDIFVRVLLFAFVGVAWNLIGGYAKQLSLGHAAYFGLGGYTSTILLIRFGVSPWIGMLAGGIVAMLASLPIGALCFRLRGPYFAIATIGPPQPGSRGSCCTASARPSSRRRRPSAFGSPCRRAPLRA